MTDTPDEIRRKFKRAVTDSDTRVRFGEDKPEISNLLTIYSAFAGCTVQEAEKAYYRARRTLTKVYKKLGFVPRA